MKYFYTFSLIALISFGFSNNSYASSAYGKLLEKYTSQDVKKNIKSTLVDYEKWRRDPLHNKALGNLISTNPKTLSGASKMAFWINSYNLLTIDLIVKNKEQKSIKNLGSLFKNPWKSHSWKIYGKKYTLDEIEHKILRPLNDPRIHMAINCASLSCPDLLNEPYDAKKLDEQLNKQTRLFLENDTKGLYLGKDETKKSLIFKWFSKDFGGKKMINIFIKKHSNKNLKPNNTYFKYNWSLNSK